MFTLYSLLCTSHDTIGSGVLWFRVNETNARVHIPCAMQANGKRYKFQCLIQSVTSESDGLRSATNRAATDEARDRILHLPPCSLRALCDTALSTAPTIGSNLFCILMQAQVRMNADTPAGTRQRTESVSQSQQQLLSDTDCIPI
jgi:hypothetical protein